MEKYEVRALLPKIGDRRLETPTMQVQLFQHKKDTRPCTVVAVNTRHLWYLVEFDNGIREAYKVPMLRFNRLGGLLP